MDLRGIADRSGPPLRYVAPLLFTGALGLASIALGAGSVHEAPGRVLVISGLLLAGAAYGGLQNLTLAQAFTAAGELARSSVSIAWNLSFDAGTGLGAFTAGAIATATSYSAAFAVSRWPLASRAAAGHCQGPPDVAIRVTAGIPTAPLHGYDRHGTPRSRIASEDPCTPTSLRGTCPNPMGPIGPGQQQG